MMIATALVVASCSATADRSATTEGIAAPTIPPTTTASTTIAPTPRTLFFPNPGLSGEDPCGAVFPVERVETGLDEPAAWALEALLAGPTPAERSAGFEAPVSPAVRANLEPSDGGLIVDFRDLLAVDPGLADVCPGRTLRSAIEATLGGTVELRLDGDAAAFDELIGTTCPLTPAAPASGTVLAYFHCAPGEPPVPLARPAAGSTTPEMLGAALEAQAAGPTLEERAAGATGIVAADGLEVGSVAIVGSTANIDFEAVGRSGSPVMDEALDELLPVIFQFADLETASLSVGGDCAIFGDPCRTATRNDARRALLSGRDRAAAAAMLDDLANLTVNGPREAGGDGERAAGDYLAARLGGTGVEVVVDDVPLPSGAATRNVSATYGEGPLHILLGAHYDSVRVSPGADDNGSGVVVLLELARRLADHVPPGLTVTVAFFGAEEVLTGYGGGNHHFGSRAMVQQMAAAGTLPDRMVSVDMVGLGGRLLAVTYLDTDASVAADLAAAAASAGVDVIRASKGDISDHEAFARAGVPAAFLWRPDNPAWHTPGDDRVDDLLLLDDLAVIEQYLGYTVAG